MLQYNTQLKLALKHGINPLLSPLREEGATRPDVVASETKHILFRFWNIFSSSTLCSRGSSTTHSNCSLSVCLLNCLEDEIRRHTAS
jgi:hypothetical protein